MRFLGRLRLPVCKVAVGLALAVAAAAPCASETFDPFRSPAERMENNLAAGRRHFIDFRAGLASITGHTFIVYGRLDDRGTPVVIRSAEIYPDDNDAGLFVGLFVPVRASIRVHDGDSKQRAVISYRHYLSEADYAAVLQAVQKERRQDQLWSVLLFNCNDFAGNVAGALGLRTPSNLLLPHAYVAALRALNGWQD